MCQFIYQAYKYFKLYSFLSNFIKLSNININNVDNLIDNIKNCGCVAIKLCQWTLPKIESMENTFSDNEKKIFKKMENFYDNCETHNINYTYSDYYKQFNRRFTDDYTIIKIIGSGSIGQTYLIENKDSEKYVMKIRHPNIKTQLFYFKLIYRILDNLCLLNKFKKDFPFYINNFIENFETQSNFINESNNMLFFNNLYKDNDFVIIPTLYKCSESIIIMSYEEGTSFFELQSSIYTKNQCCLVLDAFIKSNNIIYNFNHGDLHKGNWKIRDKCKIVLYDFGYCYRLNEDKSFLKDILKVFESTEKCEQDLIVNIIYNVIITKPKKKNLKHLISLYIDEIWPSIGNRFSPSKLYKLLISFCNNNNLILKHELIQCFIVAIQVEKIFSDYFVLSEKERTIYNVYRKTYLDEIVFFETHNIFNDYKLFLQQKMNNMQIPVENIFDSINLPDFVYDMIE